MKIIVTHKSPDLDAITSVWVIKRLLQGWEDAKIEFVSAGEKFNGEYIKEGEAIEELSDGEIIHVDTGLGKLDHHNSSDDTICAASLAFDFVKASTKSESLKNSNKFKAIERIVRVVVEDDHFKEVFRPDAIKDYQDFSFASIFDGRKIQFPDDNLGNLEFGMQCLDALLHTFESKIWAEDEIKEKGIPFKTKWGQSLAIETLNDDVLKLGQLMGYKLVVKRDPNHGFVRIKSLPKNETEDIDLTPLHHILKELDPNATWYLHVSKKMLLNGSSKNTDSVPSSLSLMTIKEQIEKL